MTWSIEFKTDRKIIELTYSGEVSPKELVEAVDAAIEISKRESATLVLADCKTMVGGHSLIDLYSLIKIFVTRDFRGLKEALLLPSANTPLQFVKFYETACRNRGFNVKVFNDYTEAVDWLVK
jgi:hypothetical protein